MVTLLLHGSEPCDCLGHSLLVSRRTEPAEGFLEGGSVDGERCRELVPDSGSSRACGMNRPARRIAGFEVTTSLTCRPRSRPTISARTRAVNGGAVGKTQALPSAA